LRKTSEKAVYANGSISMLLFSLIFLFLRGFVSAFGTKKSSLEFEAAFLISWLWMDYARLLRASRFLSCPSRFAKD